MATVSRVNLLVDCLICGLDKVDKNPRQLHCKHSFCEECLSKTSWSSVKDTIQCPVCMRKTQLLGNGIKDLPVDTGSATFRKAMSTFKDMYLCTLCGFKGMKSSAVARCNECEFRLCNSCADAHNTKPSFLGHVVVEDLCKIHIREFFHACLTCRTGLCFECVVSGYHDDHDTCDIEDAQEKAIGIMQQSKQELLEGTGDLEKRINKIIDSSRYQQRQIRKETENKLEEYRKKMLEPIRKYLEKRDDNYQKAVMAALEEQKETCAQATNCLNEINNLSKYGKLEIMSQVLFRTTEISQAIEKIMKEKLARVEIPEPLATEYSIATENTMGHFGFSCLFGPIFPCSSVSLKNKPQIVFSLEKLSTGDQFDSLYYIATLPDGSAYLGQYKHDNGVKLNPKGEVIGRYSTQKEGGTRGICQYNGDIYIGTEKGEKIITISGCVESSLTLNPSVRDVNDIAVDRDHVLLVGNDYGLWKYNHQGINKGEIDVEKVTRVTIAIHPVAGLVYLLSDYHKQELRIYKNDGQFIRTVGGKGDQDGRFSGIRGSVMLPNGHILVVDSELHRVSEFTFEGDFVRHLLNENDGLHCSRNIAYVYPYLWIACQGKVMLFTYI